MLLSKGLEIEVYTGTATGQVIGRSDRIVQDLSGFVREPDSRNVEYTTPPLMQYDRLLAAILKPRHQLRQYLAAEDLTLIPGSTLSLGGSDRFYRSDPQNPYHAYIENTYGTNVVTASIHINIGFPEVETLLRACRLVRAEAPLYLALSASSPFLDGQVTGSHSRRWQVFPHTPKEVPLFRDHRHFIDWTQAQLDGGTMQNVRHLWCSVRPNGDNRPYNLNRLELRICDLIANPIHLLAVVALLEARLLQLVGDRNLDPLIASDLNEAELLTLIRENEMAAARSSLGATVRHWRDGRSLKMADWIADLYTEVLPLAKRGGFACFLNPLMGLLREGNEAQRWLKQQEDGRSVAAIIQESIAQWTTQEQELAGLLDLV